MKGKGFVTRLKKKIRKRINKRENTVTKLNREIKVLKKEEKKIKKYI